MVDVVIKKVNETFIQIDAQRSILLEISEKFSFYAEGYKFNPKYINKQWDGIIRMLNRKTRTMYAGLVGELTRFFDDNGYTYQIAYGDDEPATTREEVLAFIKYLKLPDWIELRDYQIDTIVKAINDQRGGYISPTSSGKSFIIYVIFRFLSEVLDRKTLLIVPTVSLVHQLHSDFVSYGYDADKHVYKILSGANKSFKQKAVISTWQSIHKLDKEWFDQFSLVIGDEYHTFQATCLKTIMEKLDQCKYRFGFTGTLDGSLVNELTLIGLFGPITKVTTTNQLMQDGHVANLEIKTIILKYPDKLCQYFAKKKIEYVKEVDYLVTLERRNDFICKLAVAQTKNTLILYRFVDKQGVILYNKLVELTKGTDRKVFFISGDTSGEEREAIRKQVELEKNCIVVASLGTTSTGVSIVNLDVIIFASPSKSRIKVLQSIGRVLRKSETNTDAVLYDIADDIRWKKRENYTYKHLVERLKMYVSEKFKYKVYERKF